MPSASAAFTGTRCWTSARAAAVSRFFAALTRRTSSAATARPPKPRRAIRHTPHTRLKDMLTPSVTTGCPGLRPDRAVAHAELFDRRSGFGEDAAHQVGRGRLRLRLDMAVALDLSGGPADEDDREVVVAVLVAVAHAAAVEEQRVI